MQEPSRAGGESVRGATTSRTRSGARHVADDYAELKRLIAGKGLFEHAPQRYLGHVVTLILLFAVVLVGVVLTRGGWWVLAWAAPAAFLFGQLGFLAHDAVHNQVLHSSRRNYVLGLLLFNLILGGSRGWWADKHNLHHAFPNRLGTDPDLGGVIAISREQTVQVRGVTRLVMRRQATAIWPLLSLGVLQTHVQSIAFLRRRAVRNARMEAALLLAHYTVYLGGLLLLVGVGRGLLLALLHQLLLGIYLGGAFLPNHTGMLALQPDEQMDFLRRQVLTARNIRASRAADYLLGTLSCQIEHHLFPAMPRYRLREAAPVVRQFCRERGVGYRETGMLEAYVEVYRHLEAVAAAVYGASEGLRTLMLESVASGGQAGTSSRIENYFGFPLGISGGDLTQRGLVQAEKFSAQLSATCAASALREEAGHLVIDLSDGTSVARRAVIVASGARYRRLEVDRLQEFESKGVYYAATDVEVRQCAGNPVVVVGGGNSAGQAAAYLADLGSPVTVVIRGPELDAQMSRYLVDRLESHPNVQVMTQTETVGIDGDQTLGRVTVAGPACEAALPCVSLFSFIGADPAAEWLSGYAALDDRGFVLTDRSLTDGRLGEPWRALGRRPLPFETSSPGLFAVGDVRSGSVKRVAAAVGEGSAAVRSVHEHLAFIPR